MLAPNDKCTGCTACISICPIECISSEMDKEGFYQPIVDKDRCIKCGKCTESCPILQGTNKKWINEPKVYAAWNKDEEVLRKSSSGGIFGVFAKYIIEKDGAVFGAAYSEDLSVKHIKINSLEGLSLLQGSKYVQSDIGNSFKDVKRALDEDRYVLFSGTPCQVAGLYGFLGGDKFDKLFTCDLVCHGVPSPGVFRDYINYIEVKENAKLKTIEMRTKKRGWNPIFNINYVFDNDKEIEIRNAFKDSYMNGFLFNLYLRKSCYDCQYAKVQRESNITLADFWGIGNDKPFKHPTKQGISLVLLNNKKGQALFQHCLDNMYFEERSMEEAKKGNAMLSSRQYSNPDREKFFDDYNNIAFEHLLSKYLKRRQSLKTLVVKFAINIIGKKGTRRIKWMISKVLKI